MTHNTYYVKVLIAEEEWVLVQAESPEQAREIVESARGTIMVLEVKDRKPEE